MQYFGRTLALRDDPVLIGHYKEYHRHAWPEVVARLKEIGITEMRIFLLGRRLFMYCETIDGFDPERDFSRTLEDPTYRRWDELMRGMQLPVEEARPDEWWAAMELVFDLNWQHRRTGDRA